MKVVLGPIGIVLGLLVAGAALFGLFLWATIWWDGMLASVHYFLPNVPSWVIVVAIIGSIWVINRTAFLWALFGCIAVIKLFNWPWYEALLCYMPMIALAFIPAILALAAGVIASISALLKAAFQSRG